MLQLAAHFCENDAPWKVTAVDQLKAVQVVATTIATNSCMHATIVATTIAATTTMARSFSCRMQCRCNSSSAILLATACGTYSTVGRLTHSPQTLLCAVCCLLPLLPLLVFLLLSLPLFYLSSCFVTGRCRRHRSRSTTSHSPHRAGQIKFNSVCYSKYFRHSNEAGSWKNNPSTSRQPTTNSTLYASEDAFVRISLNI